MADGGLAVEFDGKKYKVMEGTVKEYPIGGMACEYARLHPYELKELILKLPCYSDSRLKEKFPEAMMWFFNQLKKKYGIVTTVMITTDFSNFICDYIRASDKQLKILMKNCDKAVGSDKIKEYIFKDSGYHDFGTKTVGQAFLSAYATYSNSYAIFKTIFTNLASDKLVKPEQAEVFFSFYTEVKEVQHIDFNIMLYDNGFHSVYTLKSSMSLILFEAVHIMDNNTKIVKCKNCGNYFVPMGRSDAIYCEYPSPQDKTRRCRDIGPNATRAKKVKNDIVTQEYRRLYMRLKMAIKRHPGEIKCETVLSDLIYGMKQIKDKEKEKKLAADDIIDWLRKFDDDLINNKN